ncbi:hypothetical protein FRC00_010490 [Tulasnella sp. 408]|nr:hypothetical protein FRC00_010490 [Tulasnella sp. 408]
MALTSQPFTQRIDIAKRISNAETKYREISLERFGSASPSSSKKSDQAQEDDDANVANVMEGIIAPRLARLRNSYSSPYQSYLVTDWWGVSWLFPLWRGEPDASIHRHERRIANIEIMLAIVKNHNAFGSEVWEKITKWQLLSYQRGTYNPWLTVPESHLFRSPEARKILEEFDIYISKLKNVGPEHRAYRSALAEAVERALAELPLNDVTWVDVFTIRHLSYDPSLKAAINSSWTPLGGREDLMAVIDDLLLGEPAFPPECLAREFNPVVTN